mgnify:CR=1 FL=1
MERHHLSNRKLCPELPPVEEVLTAAETAAFRRNYNSEFYYATLRYAQSLWLEGKAAQALLQLNKSFMADLRGDETILAEWPLPYAAKVWVMSHCPEGDFLGNPVRHYQHLATRMSGVRARLRRWRAWGCFHLAEKVLDQAANPRDERQIETEGVSIPPAAQVLESLEKVGLTGEAGLLKNALANS